MDGADCHLSQLKNLAYFYDILQGTAGAFCAEWNLAGKYDTMKEQEHGICMKIWQRIVVI